MMLWNSTRKSQSSMRKPRNSRALSANADRMTSGYRVGVPAGRAQELEIVVLAQDHGSRLLQAAEDVEDQRFLGGGLLVGIRIEDRGGTVAVPSRQFDPGFLALRSQRRREQAHRLRGHVQRER